MNYSPVLRIHVVLDLEGTSRKLGELGWSTHERRAYFQYETDYLKAPYTLSPFHLPPVATPQAARHQPFEGTHGLFNDSLPDGWGRLLLDRRLQDHGIDYAALTPIDRLAAVGRYGVGALRYEPEFATVDMSDSDAGLDGFAEDIVRLQAEQEVADIDRLQAAQGGSAGARPKIMIALSPDRQRVVIDYGQALPEGFEPWMVKFRSRDDPPDVGAEEQAYALMAGAAGIDMSETRLLETANGNRLFATKRFDRTPSGRLHVHTVSGLVYADHRLPSLDYEQVLKVTQMMTRDHSQTLHMFRRMVFNVFAHNRDDHAKNHAFLMNKAGQWTLSPAYDLTFSAGPGGEHSTTVAKEGRHPTEAHMLDVARRASIADRDAKAEIDIIRAAINDWPVFADLAGLTRKRSQQIQDVLTSH